MSKETLMLLKAVSWAITAALCLEYARRGFSPHPTFDRWVWTLVLTLNLLILVLASISWIVSAWQAPR